MSSLGYMLPVFTPTTYPLFRAAADADTDILTLRGPTRIVQLEAYGKVLEYDLKN